MTKVRDNRSLIALLSFLVLGWMMTADAAAAGKAKGKGKSSSAAKAAKAEEPSAAKAAAPVSDKETALASCKKHVESMLKESAVTRFQGDQELKIDHPNEANFDVSGWVTSQNNSGAVKRMDFLCHAQHSSGGLWTTKTSLFMDK